MGWVAIEKAQIWKASSSPGRLTHWVAVRIEQTENCRPYKDIGRIRTEIDEMATLPIPTACLCLHSNLHFGITNLCHFPPSYGIEVGPIMKVMVGSSDTPSRFIQIAASSGIDM